MCTRTHTARAQNRSCLLRGCLLLLLFVAESVVQKFQNFELFWRFSSPLVFVPIL